MTDSQKKVIDGFRKRGNADLIIESESMGTVTVKLRFPKLRITLDSRGKPVDQGIPYQD